MTDTFLNYLKGIKWIREYHYSTPCYFYGKFRCEKRLVCEDLDIDPAGINLEEASVCGPPRSNFANKSLKEIVQAAVSERVMQI